MSSQRTYFSLFTQEEQERLQKLERQRVVLRRKPALWISASLLYVGVMTWMAFMIELENYNDRAWPYIVMLVSTLGFFGFVAWITFKFPDRETISRKYKRLMLRRIVPHVLPGWVNASSHRLMNEDIRKSGLFRDKANRIEREDYLFGPSGKVVSEVYQIALQTESQDNRDARSGVVLQRESPTNHFYGYFFRIHCPVIFPCDVWVFPKKKKVSGEVDEWAELTEKKYSRNSTLKKVIAGNDSFDENFSVYTTDTKGAALIVTHARMVNLLELNKLFATAVAVSYTENKVYVMIGYKNDPLDVVVKEEIAEKLLQRHADELARLKDVASLAYSL
ncbi:MAG: DUF3137 domain-containing protein [Bacteroidetes bacterium]|nr:DUF3137 domain-containing protein [Bacteroidota bacterium]